MIFGALPAAALAARRAAPGRIVANTARIGSLFSPATPSRRAQMRRPRRAKDAASPATVSGTNATSSAPRKLCLFFLSGVTLDIALYDPLRSSCRACSQRTTALYSLGSSLSETSTIVHRLASTARRARPMNRLIVCRALTASADAIAPRTTHWAPPRPPRGAVSCGGGGLWYSSPRDHHRPRDDTLVVGTHASCRAGHSAPTAGTMRIKNKRRIVVAVIETKLLLRKVAATVTATARLGSVELRPKRTTCSCRTAAVMRSCA